MSSYMCISVLAQPLPVQLCAVDAGPMQCVLRVQLIIETDTL